MVDLEPISYNCEAGQMRSSQDIHACGSLSFAENFKNPAQVAFHVVVCIHDKREDCSFVCVDVSINFLNHCAVVLEDFNGVYRLERVKQDAGTEVGDLNEH